MALPTLAPVNYAPQGPVGRAVADFLSRQQQEQQKPLPPTPTTPDKSGDFRATPGYEFRLGEGRRTVENSAIARGGLLSGRAMKELERFGQDYGSAEYQNVFNRRASIAGITPPIVGNLNAMGGNFANSISNINQNLGAGLASSYMSGAASLNNAIQGGIGNYLFNQYMQGP